MPESEREGSKEGPFAGFESATVNKEGKVQDATGAIIGRLIEGEAAKLYGKRVDEDGDVVSHILESFSCFGHVGGREIGFLFL